MGAGITALIFFTEPRAVRVGATKETAMLVEVTSVKKGTYRPTLTAMGTVVAAEDLTLSTRVEGIVVKRSPAFTPGGQVTKGHTLLRIEPVDYQNTLQQKKTALDQAIAELDLEMGRQSLAQKEFEMLGEALSDRDKALVLRRPQLNTAKSKVAAARVAVTQAELDLRRTRITAPFDAHILSRDVNVGSRVSPGDNLGRLVGVETYWVETTVPLSKLRRLSFPKRPAETGSPVRIRHKTAWPEGLYRDGRLHKLLGALEEKTRMARVLVAVDDPLNIRSPDTDRPPLIIGAYVEVQIQAETIDNVFRIERAHLRKGNTVWLMKENRLRIQPVRIAFQNEIHAFVESGLTDGDRVVTTNLSTVAEGAKLRVGRQRARDNSTADSGRDAGAPDVRTSAGGSR